MTATQPGEGAGLSLDIVAKLTAGIGGLQQEVGRLNKRLDTPPPQPVFATPNASGNLSAAGALVMDLGAPPQGTMWVVRRIVVGGVTRATACAGTADVYVGSVAEVNAANLTTLRDSTNLTTLPGVAFYGDQQLTCQSSENLFVVISGGTAGQSVIAEAGITQIREGNLPQGWDL